jgi:hypothetical protein
MAICHQRSVGFGLLSAAVALALSGCAASAPDRPGALELRIDPEASYALVGRFRLTAIEPYSPSRDIDFDATTSTARLELEPGTFTLALGAGARLVCAGEDPAPFASSVPRVVSASPQLVSVSAGELTTARIRFGALSASEDGSAAASDPCSSPLALGEPGSFR